MLVPYLYHRYADRASFDRFYCSLLKLESQGKQDLLSSKMLIRAFLEDEMEDEEELDDEEYEAIKEMDDSEEPLEEIEIIENETSIPRFVSCPSISITEPSGELNEDIIDFISQLPGFQTFQSSSFYSCLCVTNSHTPLKKNRLILLHSAFLQRTLANIHMMHHDEHLQYRVRQRMIQEVLQLMAQIRHHGRGTPSNLLQ